MPLKPIYTPANATLRVLFMSLTALATWVAVALQFYITISGYPANRTLPGVIVQFFSYFTILSNILVAVSITALLIAPKGKAGQFFSRPSVITAIAVYITVVGLVYALMLRSIWTPPTLLGTIANELLHTCAPLLYLIFWTFFVNKTDLKWGSLMHWLIFPGAYIIYITIRGAITGMYPYPFIDVSAIGYLKAFVNTAILLLVFLILSVILTSIGKFLAERQR